jgi:sugar lactone lactonase YvrE
LWVADTRSPCLAVVSGIDNVPSVRALQGPHPTRALLADAAGRGMWLGASDRAELTLVGPDGDVRHRHELPGIPFGLCALADGRIAVAVKDADVLAVVDPTGDRVEAVHLPAGSLPMGCTAVGDRILVTLAGRSEIADLPIAGRSVGVRGKDDESSLGVGNG